MGGLYVRRKKLAAMPNQPSSSTRFIAFAVNLAVAWFLLTRESIVFRGIGWFVAFCLVWPLINWIQAIIRTVSQSTVRTTDSAIGISFRKPIGWQLIRPEPSAPYVLVHATPVNGFSPNINLQLDTTTRDAEGRLHAEVEETRLIEPTLGLCLPESKTVGDISGFQTSTTAFMDGAHLRFYWFTLQLPTGVLLLTLTVPEGHQHAYLTSFHDYIATIAQA